MELQNRLTFGLGATDFQRRIDMQRMRSDRLAKTKSSLREHGIAAALFAGTKNDNTRYATGLKGVELAIVFAEESQPTVIFAREEHCVHLRVEAPGVLPENVRSYPIIEPQGGLPAQDAMVDIAVPKIVAALTDAGIPRGPVAGDFQPAVAAALTRAGVEVIPLGMAMYEAREIKTDDEINCLKMVGALTDAAWARMVEVVRPGITDREVAAVGTEYLVARGAEDFVISLRTGPVGGPNWGLQTDRIMQPGDLGFGYVMGNLYMGYHACYHRTWSVGVEPTAEQKAWHQRCYEWITAAQEAIKPGVSTADVAAVFPTAAMYGVANEYEVASDAIAHGVGVGAHDIPTISRAWSLDHPQPIRIGQVIALHFWYGEQGKGGARIENLGVVTENGWENLYTFPYDGIVVPPYRLDIAR